MRTVSNRFGNFYNTDPSPSGGVVATTVDTSSGQAVAMHTVLDNGLIRTVKQAVNSLSRPELANTAPGTVAAKQLSSASRGSSDTCWKCVIGWIFVIIAGFFIVRYAIKESA